MDAVCIECGSPLPPTGECWSRVHELLVIESRVLIDIDPEIGMRAHFYAIGSYQLQHPSRSTWPVLAGLAGDLAAMLNEPRPMGQVRLEVRRRLRGGQVARRAKPDDRGHVPARWPTRWSVTAAAVIARPDSQYVTAVGDWAEATVAQLAAVGVVHRP